MEEWIYVFVIQGISEPVTSVSWNPIFPLEFITINPRTFHVWRISASESPESISVDLLWISDSKKIYTSNAIIKGTFGLSPTNRKLLVQGGAIDKIYCSG